MRLPASFVPVLVIAVALVSLMAMRVSGAPNGSLAVQAIAFVLAALLALPKRTAAWVESVDARWLGGAILLVTIAVLVAGVEIEGARRWLRVGPVLLHPASLLGSILLLALARGPGNAWCTIPSGAAIVCFGLGNDGAASLAFALGSSALLLVERKEWKTLLPLCVLAWCMAAWGWTRPDTLAPVPWVEQIISQTWTASELLGIAAGVLLAMLPLPFVLAALEPGRRSAGLALAGFWIGLLVAGLVGNYPVPVIGYGASPVIGWLLALRLVSSRSA
ncbi:MAG: FtsW/RodA/SpoVE family cell cycle protein [Pseudomonadota bacterium]